MIARFSSSGIECPKMIRSKSSGCVSHTSARILLLKRLCDPSVEAATRVSVTASSRLRWRKSAPFRWCFGSPVIPAWDGVFIILLGLQPERHTAPSIFVIAGLRYRRFSKNFSRARMLSSKPSITAVSPAVGRHLRAITSSAYSCSAHSRVASVVAR